MLISDGEQTRGDAVVQTLVAEQEDLELSVVHVGRADGPEALLDDLVVPERVDEGAAYEVKVVARSQQDTSARVRLYRNDTYLGATERVLKAGRPEVWTVRERADAAGLYRYRAVLEVDEAFDAQPENNQVVGTVQVAGSPRILVVEGGQGDGRHVAEAMERSGLEAVSYTHLRAHET